VHYVPATAAGAPAPPYRQRRCIPAIVSRVWSPSSVSLVVFADGGNDLDLGIPRPLPLRHEPTVLAGPPTQVGELVNSEWHNPDDCPYERT
jgi:hypothetical protein